MAQQRTHGMPVVYLIIRNAVTGSRVRSFTVPPKHVKRMEHDIRSEGVANVGLIELFDENWGILDDLLPLVYDRRGLNDNIITFSYGWHDALSPERKLKIFSHKPGDVTILGVTTTLEFIDEGYLSLPSKSLLPQQAYRLPIVEIIKRVCQEQDPEWIPDVDPPKVEVEYEGGPIKEYQRDRRKPLEFFKYLASVAVPASGQGIYEAKLEGRTLIFKPQARGDQLYKQYSFMYSTDSEVISFEPDTDSIEIGRMGGSGIRANVQKADSRVTVEVQKDSSNVQNSFVNLPETDELDQVERINLRSGDEVELTDAMDALYARIETFKINASMQIWGDVDIRPTDYISIDVRTPKGDSFFTSGIYRVFNVKNTIEPGRFTTDLDLVKFFALKEGRRRFGLASVPANRFVVKV